QQLSGFLIRLEMPMAYYRIWPMWLTLKSKLSFLFLQPSIAIVMVFSMMIDTIMIMWVIPF
ncbi:MAG: hypothetical protein WD135_00290, partial [Ferruginibacter sp.]